MKEPKASISKVRKLLSCSFLNLRSQDLKKGCGEGFNTVWRRIPTSFVNESYIYGREKEKEAVLELLLDGEVSGNDGVCMIATVGMGGLGKTTLAQLVYNDARVDYFNFKVEFLFLKILMFGGLQGLSYRLSQWRIVVLMI